MGLAHTGRPQQDDIFISGYKRQRTKFFNLAFVNTGLERKINYEDIVFFSLAEGGAMGCPGEVLVATKKNNKVKWYCFNTMVDSFEDLCSIYPPLKTFDCGIFGEASGIQDGWNHVDLGMGNHLLVREDYIVAFQNAVDELHVESLGEVYASWRGIAQILLTVKVGEPELAFTQQWF